VTFVQREIWMKALDSKLCTHSSNLRFTSRS
jgi:hypothetical protein